MDGRQVATFAVRRLDVLSHGRAEALATEAQTSVQPILVVFERSSPKARALLRERGLSYAADDGELFVFAPPIYVERPARRRAIEPSPQPAAPFATRASRVPRWLLLHADERPSFRDLAHELELSEAMVSRTVRALADDGLVAVDSDPADARRRLARLRDPAALLDAYERAVVGRRPRRVTWDVGAREAPAAIASLREAAEQLKRPYAISGVAGAAFVRRVVEPSDVTILLVRDDSDLWAEELMAAPARPGPGRITAQLAPDPFVLSLATRRDDVWVADPVQLYLDCRLAGERAIEAAEAIRAEMDW